MPSALKKLLRLATAHGPATLLRAALDAALDACRERRFRVAASPVPDCGFHTVWRRPTRRRFEQALRKRLGIAQPDFRRRAESADGIDERPSEAPVTATVLLAGARVLDDARLRAFLLAQAADGTLRLVRPGDAIAPQPGKLTLLTGLEADAEGQACLLALRRCGIACDWLTTSTDTALQEIPLREACLRQATPSADGNELDYSAIAVPQRLTFPERTRPVQRRPLRVLTYRWHVPHQYELFKLGAEFTLVADVGEGGCRWWDLGQRPLPANARFARWRDIDPRNFDLAILHFDENVLPSPGATSPAGAEWGKTFRFLLRNLNIPQVAVCHGSPRAADRFACDGPRQRTEANRIALIELLGDILVVVNSHQVQPEWAFRQSRVIWHGFDPEEFNARPGPPNNPLHFLTLPAESFAELPQNRGADLLDQVVRLAGIPMKRLCVPEPSLLLSGNAYAHAKFASYVTELQRFDVYFNPTLHSPMPRSRGEAMLCGLATVNADSHDVDRFIENGMNGFYAATAEEFADQIGFLLADPARAWRIGQAGRETAMRLFHIDRYLDDWRRLIRDVLGHDAI